jgi:hypothetical protein
MVEPMEMDHATKIITKYDKVLHPPYDSPQYIFNPEFRSSQYFKKEQRMEKKINSSNIQFLN